MREYNFETIEELEPEESEEELDEEPEEDSEIPEPEEEPEVQEDVPDWVPPSLVEIVDQVIAGHWGTGQDRRTRLEAAGYSHVAVQKELVRRINHR